MLIFDITITKTFDHRKGCAFLMGRKEEQQNNDEKEDENSVDSLKKLV